MGIKKKPAALRYHVTVCCAGSLARYSITVVGTTMQYATAPDE
jgi:hypothetical protein